MKLFYSLSLLLLIAFLISCASNTSLLEKESLKQEKISQIDFNGNPIFHSLNKNYTEYEEFELSTNYYTLKNNIQNPYSSVFISENLTLSEIESASLNLISNFYFLLKDGHLHSIVSLSKKRIDTEYYEFSVMNLIDNNVTTYSSILNGDITEFRAEEIIKNNYDPNSKIVDDINGSILNFNNHNLKIIKNETIEKAVIELISRNKLDAGEATDNLILPKKVQIDFILNNSRDDGQFDYWSILKNIYNNEKSIEIDNMKGNKNEIASYLWGKSVAENGIDNIEDAKKLLSDINPSFNEKDISFMQNGFYVTYNYIQSNSIQAEELYQKGAKYDRNHNTAKAIEFFKKAITYSPYHLYANNDLGIIYRDKNRFNEALDCYLRIIKILPDSGMGYHVLGVVYANLSEEVKALNAFQTAASLGFQESIELLENREKDLNSLVKKIHIDHFVIKDWEIDSYFFDPMNKIISSHPDFSQVDGRQQSTYWTNYFKTHAIYLFEIKNKKNDIIKYVIIRGNRSEENTAKFYVADFVDATKIKISDPNSLDYSEFVENTIDLSSTRGSLFEHMEHFQKEENKRLIGNGIQFFQGIFAFVATYEPTETEIKELIKEEMSIE